MRNSTSWKCELIKGLSTHADNPSVLCDVELALTLVSEVCPRESHGVVPALMSANTLPALKTGALSGTQRGMLARARALLRCQGDIRWKEMLRSYRSESELVRIYDVGSDGFATSRQSSICPDRREAYLDALNSPPPYSDRTSVSAESGTYLFPIRTDDGTGPQEWRSVTFSEQEIQSIPRMEPRPLRPAKLRHPLTISWKDLRQTAEWMDRQDAGSWLRRLDNMRLKQNLNEDDGHPDLALDGMFHLVGMVSSGKSTLMDIIAVWTARSGMRIMLVVGDNVDVTTRVERFRKLGLSSAPLMGLGRRERRREQIERIALSESREDNPPWKDSRLRWVSPICPIIDFGASDMEDIPPGSEPCENLYEKADLNSTRRTCPLMPVCPVHLSRNEMMEASIWVGTPQSLFLTRTPAQTVADNVRLLETVYRECDLLIVDEADKVQAQLDDMFAPSVNLIQPSGRGFMEILDRNSAAPEGRSLSRILSRPDVLGWSRAQRTSQQAANTLLHLCENSCDLRMWTTQREYFTAFGLANQLHSELVSSEDRRPMPEELIDFLNQPDLDSPLRRLAMELSVYEDESNLSAREEECIRWLRGIYSADSVDRQEIEFLKNKLNAIALTASLDNRLKSVFDNWEVGEGAYRLGLEAESPFHRPPREYESLIPTSPTGNLFGFRYRRNQDDGDAQLEMFRCTGVGRWALTNLHDMFRNLDGAAGPHVILLSGSSWAPGSSTYHVQATVDGVLLPPDTMVEAISKSSSYFSYALDERSRLPIRISGTSGELREKNLTSLLAFLSEIGSDGKSQIERELALLATSKAGGDCILMITGSYEEAHRAYDFLNGRVSCGVRYLTRDNEYETDHRKSGDGLARGQVNRFAEVPERILIAPLLAIERGHNIISEDGRAAIGSVYFLVRPMPVPHQFSSAVREMNHWAVKTWYDNELANARDSLLTEWREYRRKANAAWQEILHNPGQFRNATEHVRRNLVWTQLVALWQTVGRAVRGGSSVRVHFCDAAFAPESAGGETDTERTSMLLAMRAELNRYLDDSHKTNSLDQRERDVCRFLYSPWAETLSNIRNLDD